MSIKRAYIVNTWNSPYAVLRPIALNDVTLKDDFWAPRIKQWIKKSLLLQYQMLEENGRIDRFRWASGKIHRKPDKSIHPFDDSDVYKWLEACAYALALFPNNVMLRDLVDQIVAEVIDAQEGDGYLFTEYKSNPSFRWSKLSLAHAHELYCAGHLIQAAIALHRCIGSDKLLKSSINFADLIVKEFGPSKLENIDGHPGIEMALVELYREIGKKEYLDAAIFFLNERGKKEHLKPEEKEYVIIYNLLGGAEFYIDHKPYRELHELTGHAVAALYLNCGATDIFLETGEIDILQTLMKLWNDMMNYKIYITGGVGSRHVSESFGKRFELPNERSYAESCAAVANFMWNWRMFLATGDAKFVDVMELLLYNAVLASISLDGSKYFYFNPLADRGEIRRQNWFTCACCPPNLLRLLISVPGYFYCLSEKGIWINFYATSEARISYNGIFINLKQVTNYPWDGNVKIKIFPEKALEFSIFLRIPGWCNEAKVTLDGKALRTKAGTYLEIKKLWDQGDALELILPMTIKLMTSHPHVSNNFARVALKRGPIVYCLEQADNQEFDVWDVLLINSMNLNANYERDLLGGVVTILGEGVVFDKSPWKSELYTSLDQPTFKMKKVKIKAIPYYAWGNRQPGPMIVWIPYVDLMKYIVEGGMRANK